MCAQFSWPRWVGLTTMDVHRGFVVDTPFVSGLPGCDDHLNVDNGAGIGKPCEAASSSSHYRCMCPSCCVSRRHYLVATLAWWFDLIVLAWGSCIVCLRRSQVKL